MVEIGQIIRMLSARTDELVLQLLPRATRDARYWTVGSLGGEPGQSLVIRRRDGGRYQAGDWIDYASGQHGDGLDLIAEIECAGDKKAAVAWAKSWLGLDGTDPERLRHTRRQVERAEQRPSAAEDDPAEHRAAALRIFLAAAPLRAGCLVTRYLAGRAIDLAYLATLNRGRLPRAIRCHPALWNKESSRKWPAMVALIEGADGVQTLHRTWLELRGDGRVTKAPLDKPKMVLGPYAGGAIRLWRGASGRAWKDHDPALPLWVSEGIEDGISVAIAAPEHRIAAAISQSNIGGVILPPGCSQVVLIGQNDTKPDAIRGGQSAIQRLTERGITVDSVHPPAAFKDFNDLLRAAAAGRLPLPTAREA